jgi:hypothetical protein
MSKYLSRLAAALICGAGIAIAAPAAAMPASQALALKKALPGAVETVRWGGGWGGWHGGGWHGGWHGGWGRGWGWGGFAAGAVIGSALAAPYYYGGYYPYGYYPAYPAPYPPAGYYGGPGGDATAYCMQRYRSYDPQSGTFLGLDGARHPCP